MHPAIGGVAEPDFLFIGSQGNAVTGTTVQFNRAFLKAGHFHALNALPRGEVSDFETQERVVQMKQRV